ncbi:hypothetical protein DSECCO2_312570 [anaerobic digester metagenome]|jgi:hypothetical protein
MAGQQAAGNRPRFWEYVASHAITPGSRALRQAGLVRDQLHVLNLSIVLNIFRLRHMIYDKGYARHPEQGNRGAGSVMVHVFPDRCFRLRGCATPLRSRGPALNRKRSRTHRRTPDAGAPGTRGPPGGYNGFQSSTIGVSLNKSHCGRCRSRSRSTKNIKPDLSFRGGRAGGEGVPPPAGEDRARTQSQRSIR